MPNGAGAVTLPVKVPPPSFVTVKVFVEFCPTGVSGNDMPLGLTTTEGPFSPVPETAKLPEPPFVVIVTVPLNCPSLVGLNWIVID
jgi:hypothetical protein